VTVLLPSILAAEAAGQGQFELEADTVGDALRALPVANMLFDEHGELRRLVNVYVDGVDIRGGDGVEAALAGGEELRVVQAIAGGSRREVVPPENLPIRVLCSATADRSTPTSTCSSPWSSASPCWPRSERSSSQ
jgi:molybdopterin synthase sulfur carrier subunit